MTHPSIEVEVDEESSTVDLFKSSACVNTDTNKIITYMYTHIHKTINFQGDKINEKEFHLQLQ